KVRVARRDLARGDVALPPEAEDPLLDRRQVARAEAPLVEAPRDVDEVEVRPFGQGRHAAHDGARAEERDVEGLTVEGDEHRGLLDALRKPRDDGGLLAHAAEEELLRDEVPVFEEGEADEEGHGARAAGEARGLGVEVERAAGIAGGEL